MPLSLDAVDRLARSLPGVGVVSKWNRRTWAVGDRGFAWERPLTKADLGRLGGAPPPVGDIVAVQVENLDAKDGILAMGLAGVFTIEHFNGYPAVLIELRLALAAHVRALIRQAHGHASALAANPPKRRRSSKRG